MPSPQPDMEAVRAFIVKVVKPYFEKWPVDELRQSPWG